jgi:hypothetical protein
MKLVKRRVAGRLALGAALVGIAMIVAALVFAAGRGSAGTSTGLKLIVAPTTTKGPLTACSAEPCSPETTIHHFLYVENKKPLPPEWGRSIDYNRDSLPGAFVMSSVEDTILVNGSVYFTATDVPPPDIPVGLGRRNSGHWPSTVTCPPEPSTDPCNVVGRPAILPGEKTVALWERWTHGADEPNGTYVFRFTIHGTLDGTPVTLTADSPPIVMTD